MVEVFAKIRLIFYTCPTCISQVQITSRKSLVNIEYLFWKGYFCGKNVFLKRRGTWWTTKTSNCTPTTKFRRRTAIRHWKSKRVPREVSSPCGYLCSSIGINRLANGAQNEAQRSFHCKTTTFNISLFPWNKLILSCYALLSWSLHFNSVANHLSCCPCNSNPKARFHSMVWTPYHGCCREIQRHGSNGAFPVWQDVLTEPTFLQPTKSRRRRIR